MDARWQISQAVTRYIAIADSGQQVGTALAGGRLRETNSGTAESALKWAVTACEG